MTNQTPESVIAEARKLLEDYPNYQEYAGGPLLKYPHQDALRRTVDALEAAEARIAELEAGEWEYGVKWHDGLDPVWYNPYTVDEAEKKLADWPKEPGYVVTRRKAGEWVPVESEGTDD